MEPRPCINRRLLKKLCCGPWRAAEIPVAADMEQPWKPRKLCITPENWLVSYFGQTYRDAREVLARIKDSFKVLLRCKPTYGGEAIPISGSGIFSHDE